MNTNNTVRDKAIFWWGNTKLNGAERVEWKVKLTHKYYGDYNYTNLTDAEIQNIYESENAIHEHPQSKDTVPEMEWDLYPGNEAGAFDHLDNQQFNEDMAIKALEDNTVPVQVEGFTSGQYAIGNGGNTYANNRGYEVALTVKEENNSPICLGFIWGETKEQSKANAQRIVTAVNNFDAMYAALKEFVNFDLRKSDFAFADKDDINGIMDIITKAKAILNRINQ